MAALVGLVAIALLTGACGSADSGGDPAYTVQADTTIDPGSPAESFSKAEYLARVDEICRKAWVTILDNWAEYSSWQEPGMRADARFDDAYRLSLLAGITFHIFDNIYNLGAPARDRREVEKIIGTLQLATELGGRRRTSSVEEMLPQFADYNRLARDYGFDECLVDEARLGDLELSPVS